MVINIPGADVAKGHTLAEYFGSGPPQVNLNRARVIKAPYKICVPQLMLGFSKFVDFDCVIVY